MIRYTWKSPIFNILDRFTIRENQFYNFFMKTQNWTVEQLKDYQLKKLREISQVWNLGIESWEDFYRLPLTTKDDMWNWKPPEGVKHHTHETSGSTGEPRVIYVPWETWYRKDAIFHRTWTWLGRTHQPVLRLIAGEPQYGWYDWWRNEKPVNYYTMNSTHVALLAKMRPYLIHGPGGAIRILCEEAIRQGKGDILKDISIVWGSQSSEGHRERLSKFIKGFHEIYGLAELPTVGNPCPYNTHIVMETGIVEIIDGEIVVTDFNNYVMPIIRYKTGDAGCIRESDCPCGRHHPILYDIEGRGVDYYFGPDVKREIGWWVVSPISHKFGQIISAWRAEVFPKQGKFQLHIVFRDAEDFDRLEPYKQWIREETGLECEIIKHSSAPNWKRNLVRVDTNEG